MEAPDIARITYELTRLFEDRIRMQYEDERSSFIATINGYQKRHEKDVRTANFLKSKYGSLSNKCKQFSSAENHPQLVSTPAPPMPIPTSSVTALHKGQELKRKPIDTGLRLLSSANVTSSTSNPSLISSLKKPKKDETILLNSAVVASSSAPNNRISNVKPPKQAKFVDVIRKKSERENIPGFECDECRQYFTVLEQQGIFTPGSKAEMLQKCSRHKSRFTPPSTPEGYWDLSIKDNWAS